MSGIEIYDECWPVLLAVVPDRALTDDEWLNFLARTTEYSARPEPMLLVTDAPGGKHLPGARQRALIAQNASKPKPGSPPSFAVMHSDLFRGMVKALGWLSRQHYNVVFVATLEEALTEVTAYAREHGITLPADLAALLVHRAAPARK